MKLKVISVVGSCMLLSGCALPNIAGIASPITALTTAASDAAALDQELADEFIKQSAVLYFLSNKTQTCLDNDGLTPTYAKNKQIQRQEEAILRLRLVDLYNLSDYADSLAKLEKDRVARAASIDNANRIIASGVQAAGYFPLVGEEAKAVKTSAESIGALVKLIDQNATAYKIMKKAKEMQPEVEKMITRLEDKFHIVSDRTQLYVNAWRACTREKFLYIRDNMASTARPVAVLDLDASYTEFRSKYRDYLNRIPHIEKESFEKIKKANRDMANTDTAEEFAAASEKLAALVDQLVSTYKTVKASERSMSGS